MSTDEFGTSLKEVAAALNRRGLTAKGLRLSLSALWNKKLPAVALLREGHFVIDDGIADGEVRTWDPDLDGAGADGEKRYSWKSFEKAWTGMALLIE